MATIASKRVATRDLIQVEQRWQRRTRTRIKPPPVVIFQIHRADREVEIRTAGATRSTLISFTELRSKYRLLPLNDEATT